jgi:hypothetical protein
MIGSANPPTGSANPTAASRGGVWAQASAVGAPRHPLAL